MPTSLPHKVITDSEPSFKQNARKLLKNSYEYEIEQDYRHNASSFLLFESLWGLGLPFAMIATVVPAYMTAISAPKVLIGIVVSLPITLSPLQLITSYHYEQRHRKHWLVFSHMASGVPWLLYTLTALFFPGMLSPQFHWLLFTLSIVVFLSLITASGSVYLSLMMDCTPLKKRGTLFGYRMAGVALGLTLMSPLAWWVMRRWPEGQNYLVAFCIAIPIYIAASATLFRTREHRNPETRTARRRNHPKIIRFLPAIRLTLRQLVREPNYRVFMFFTVLFFVPLMMGSFIVVYARERLNVGVPRLFSSPRRK
jgi:MFS family permease